MNLIKKVGDYVKNNKLYVCVMIIGIVLFAIQMKVVVLYADDFSLGIISKGGLSAAFNHLIEHYMTWGGGLTAFIAVIFLMFEPIVWKIFNCILISLTVILSVRMITYHKKINKGIIASIIWLCIYSVTIWISREALYWLDGALAYAFSAFQVFIYFYYLYTRMELKIEKKYDKILLPLVAFFAGWSSAQTGPIAILISILMIVWKKVIKKEKVLKIVYVSLILTVIGFAIFYFAPGNSARMDTFEEYANFNIIEKILYRVDSVYGLMFDFNQYPFMGVPFYLLLTLGILSCVVFEISKREENSKIKVIMQSMSVIQLLFVIFCMCVALKIPGIETISNNIIYFANLLTEFRRNTFSIKMLIPYGVATIIMISSIILAYYIAIKKKDPILVLTLIAAFISQGVMVMAPYSPLRTTYYAIMFLWIAIAYLIKTAYEDNIKIGMIAILVIAMYNVQLGIASIIAYLLVQSLLLNHKNNDVVKYEIILVICIMFVIGSINYIRMVKNYNINKGIYEENIAKINSFKQEQQKGTTNNELHLLLPEDETYGFTPLVGIPWVEDAVKDYFELGDIKILPVEE